MAVAYVCPVDKRLKCSWEGCAYDIKQHFEKQHKCLLSDTNSIQVNLQKAQENMLFNLEEDIYLVQSYVRTTKLFLKLRYLGLQKQAEKLRYGVLITVNGIQYGYETTSKVPCIQPKIEGWEINLESLEGLHGKLEFLTCTFLVERRSEYSDNSKNLGKHLDTPLKINNCLVENNVCDITEAQYLDALMFVDGKIQTLTGKKEYDDIMDKISNLNFSILEEPFPGGNTTISNEFKADLAEMLPDIREEVNLSCSSCNLDMLPPIFLCVNGHNVCNRCKNNTCKICHGIMTINRNTTLENFSRTYKHLCRYSSEGCNEKLLYNEVRAHEIRCQFCKFKCCDCPYEGRYEHFINHLKIVHASVKIHTTLRSEFPKNTKMYLVNKTTGIFYCTSEQRNDYITWTAVYCGPRERQFFCELSFKGGKFKEPIFLKRRDNIFEISKSVDEMKKMKAKEKYAILSITSYGL